MKSVKLPTTVHCDHLIQAEELKENLDMKISNSMRIMKSYKFLDNLHLAKYGCWVLESGCWNNSSSGS